MVPHIHPDVDDVIEAPEPGQSVSLAIVVEGDDVDGVTTLVESLGGKVKRSLQGGVITADMPEEEVEALSNSDKIASISPDGELRILA